MYVTHFQLVEEQFSEEVQKMEGVPLLSSDWSIKNRIRFMSSEPFKCSQNIKSVDLTKGMTDYIRCQNNKVHINFHNLISFKSFNAFNLLYKYAMSVFNEAMQTI